MKIEWENRAEAEFYQILTYGKKTFGLRCVQNLQREVELQTLRLSLFPQMGSQEYCLCNLEKEYRSIVVYPHFKLIYYINEAHETIYIVDIWDTRMSPTKLIRRFR